MALTDITDKILSEARLKSESILKEACFEAERILEKAKAEGAKIKEEILKSAQKESARRLRSAEVSLNMNLKNSLLTEKQAVLDEVFNEAKRVIASLGQKEYRDFIRRVLLRAVKEGSEEIIISQNDKERLNENFINSINAELSRSGKKGDLKPIFDKKTFNGFIVKTRNVRIDCTIDTLLKQLRPEMQSELVRILFG
ncbi:MAG: hypothetical protein FJZ16_01995 [Candidatus Omnitrophica bacterium]|nr:hypothetical protein [Candidatus Omnitrophota bacterium]